jgi:hypothetical protein
MTIPKRVFSNVIAVLNAKNVRRAVAYLDAKTVVMATRQRKFSSRGRSHTILLTYGAPNYRQREFIKICAKAKEPLPLRKIQIEFWPKRRG